MHLYCFIWKNQCGLACHFEQELKINVGDDLYPIIDHFKNDTFHIFPGSQIEKVTKTSGNELYESIVICEVSNPLAD